MGKQADQGKASVPTPDRIAFITMHEVEKDVFRGAALVTDGRSKPVEFRCTSPIQPNAVQRTLYGKSLRPHMALDLSGLPLLKSLKESAQIVMVDHEDLLELRRFVSVPVFWVRKQGAEVEARQSNPQSEELLSCDSGKFQPLVLTPHWEFPSDADTWRTAIRAAFAVADLAEPFERAKTALSIVHEKSISSGR